MRKNHLSRRYKHKILALVVAMIMAVMMITGCGRYVAEESKNDKLSSEKVILTEQGEVIEKENDNMNNSSD